MANVTPTIPASATLFSIERKVKKDCVQTGIIAQLDVPRVGKGVGVGKPEGALKSKLFEAALLYQCRISSETT